MNFEYLAAADPEIADAISNELKRQRSSIELIASENFVSLAVMEQLVHRSQISMPKDCRASVITVVAGQ